MARNVPLSRWQKIASNFNDMACATASQTIVRFGKR
jgi:hypothetical protein